MTSSTAGLNPTLFEHVHPLGTYTLQHPTARPVRSDRSAYPAPPGRVQQ
jgi:hypothetical protein